MFANASVVVGDSIQTEEVEILRWWVLILMM
jgi:hypothetical protein